MQRNALIYIYIYIYILLLIFLHSQSNRSFVGGTYFLTEPENTRWYIIWISCEALESFPDQLILISQTFRPQIDFEYPLPDAYSLCDLLKIPCFFRVLLWTRQWSKNWNLAKLILNVDQHQTIFYILLFEKIGSSYGYMFWLV